MSTASYTNGTDYGSDFDSSPLAVRRVTYDKFVLLGDSLTELSSDVLSLNFALTPALQQHYSRKLAVVARGYGGYSSEHLRHVLLPTLKAETAAAEKIRLLILAIGTNDASLNPMQAVTTDRYAQNMSWMIEQAKVSGAERVIVVGPGALDETKLESPIYNKTKRNLEYAEVAKELSKDHGVPFINMWEELLLAAGWRQGESIPGEQESGMTGGLGDLLTDGVHLSGDGYRIWYTALLKTIRAEFPELRSEALSPVQPLIQ